MITPTDHLILDANRFMELIQISIETALNEDKIVTLGILPTRPDTGYGYIEFDQQESRKSGSVNKVLKFQEKPSLEIAQSFLDAGNYYWNAGIFVWKASIILQAFEQFQPTLFELFANDLTIYGTHLEKSMIADAFEKCEDISIDFAILEYAKNIAVVLADFDWSDLGTWGSLTDHLAKDDNDNAVVGQKVFLYNSSNCLIHVPNDKLV